MPLSTGRVGKETIEKVMEALSKEADFDGLCTVNSVYLAEKVGIHRSSVSTAIHKLTQAGRIQQVGRIGRGGALMLQIED
jgi:GTP-sensing pleiotropic transcriptional regulator CodY